MTETAPNWFRCENFCINNEQWKHYPECKKYKCPELILNGVLQKK